MKQHEQWLAKAQADLKSAQKLLAGEEPLLDTAVYHAQQTAEKALKAYLTSHGQAVQRTHDLEYLVRLCSDFDPTFSVLIDDARTLTPLGVIFRYPGIVSEPSKEEVEEAIQKAERILIFVKTRTV